MTKNIVFETTFLHSTSGIGEVTRSYARILEEEGIHSINYLSITKGFTWIQYLNPITHVKFYRKLKKQNIDVLFVPHYFVPFLIPKKAKVYVIVHDVMAISRAKIFHSNFPKAKSFFLKKLLSISLNGKQIISPSYSAKDDLYKTLKLNSIVIPNGVLIPEDLSEKQVERKKEFLYIGSDRKHKNLKYLQDLFFKYNLGSLTNIGNKNNSLNGLKSVQSFSRLLSQEELLEQYLSHKYNINPSLCEGFGLTTIESLKMGLVVFTNQIPTIDEFYGLNIISYRSEKLQYFTEIFEIYLKGPCLFNRHLEVNELFRWDEARYFIKNIL